MKTGKSIIELAQELHRQQELKKDYVIDTRNVRMEPQMIAGKLNPLALNVDNRAMLNVTDNTHKQVAQRVQIPQKYYDRMITEAPELLRYNVNHWFTQKPEKRMIRTLDGNARAFLSDRYRALDNYDLANAVLPVLSEAKDMQIASCEITERRMYIKALFPRIESEVKVGDAVQSGVVISNSEIGSGALKVEPLIYRLVCLNGMVATDYTRRHTHLGRAADEGEIAYELYSDETLKADDRALWGKIQDTVRAFATDQNKFNAIVERMRQATENKLADPMKTVEATTKRFQFTEGEQSDVLRHLIEGGDLSQYGLLNAITRTAQDVESYDRSTELERVGGTILDLSRDEWQVIGQAA